MRWIALNLLVMWLAGCPNQVPETARFSTPDAIQAADTAPPADVVQPSDATPRQVSDGSSADTSAVDAGCQAAGCPPPAPCHAATCQADGTCQEAALADGEGCGSDHSCHSGICLPDPPKPLRVVAGGNTTCILLTGGSVRCWGDDEFGQLGDGQSGTMVLSATPVTVQNVSGATDLACGTGHCCALVAGGAVRCWGRNDFGESNPAAAGTLQLQAVDTAGLGVASGITTGVYHTCAIVTDGKVRCWGLGTSGQLGDGNSGMPAKIVDTLLDSYALEVRAGGHFTCARDAYAKASCWGDNAAGQIGNGKGGTSVESDAPSLVGDFTDVAALATGDEHACAMRKSGEVWCWGSDSGGELGNDGGNAFYPSPVQAQGMADMKGIAAGTGHTCAIDKFGGVWCWGANGSGQAGLGKAQGMAKTPGQVPGMAGVLEVATGDAHTCARRSDGSVWCWGANTFGQCGAGGGGNVFAAVRAY